VCSTIIGAAVIDEVDDADKPERAQSRVIETTATVDVSDAHRHMIQHRTFPLGQLQRICWKIGQL
jgi:hypothetical protein